MPSTERAPARGGDSRQRGAALVEALVASAILGIVGMVGLTGWDAATSAAQKGVREAWARCVVRSEADAILAAPWSDQGYPSSDPSLVQVSNPVVPPGRPMSGQGAEQQIVVQAFDPTGAGLLFQVTVLKVFALQGAKDMSSTTVVGPQGDVTVGCPDPRPSVTP